MNDAKLNEFPDNFTQEDERLITTALTNAWHDAQKYNGSFKAGWLLSDFNDPLWITANKGREEKIGSKWSGTNNINWDIPLPNGSRLTDERYSDLLVTIKKSAFLIREGLTGKIFGCFKWKTTVLDTLRISRWTVLHEKDYRPQDYGLRLIDQAALDALFFSLSMGGWFVALEIAQRIMYKIAKFAPNTALPIDFSNENMVLCPESTQAITQWFKANNFYRQSSSGKYSGLSFVDRNKVANLIDEDVSMFVTNNRAAAFLRQFEPDFLKSDLLLPTVQHHEYPDQNTVTTKSILNSKFSRKALETTSDSLNVLFSTHRHISTLMPDPVLVSSKRSFNKFRSICADKRHTPFIPVNIGLGYLNTAVAWVNNYGGAIVGCFEQWIGFIDFKEYRKLDGQAKRCLVHQAKHKIDFTSFHLGSTGNLTLFDFIDTSTYFRYRVDYDYQVIRDKPTLEEALKILVGACIVCIGLLKPSRRDELSHLPLNCLIEKSDGYYLSFTLGKSNIGDHHQKAEKPIPYITAVAIKLLQKISRCVSRAYGTTGNYKNKLFNLPSNSLGKSRKLHSGTLSEYLNDFCDYANLPVDGCGRRWYIRIHEMRKWFLLLLFWSGRYDVLDAARWIAGHTDASHLYAYIEREFPGEELPQLEAEYAMDRLLRLETSGIEDNDSLGIEKLYQKVLTQFNATSLSMIPNSEWEDYIVSLRMEDGFVLEPHSIYGKNDREVIGVNVCFVLRELHNE